MSVGFWGQIHFPILRPKLKIAIVIETSVFRATVNREQRPVFYTVKEKKEKKRMQPRPRLAPDFPKWNKMSLLVSVIRWCNSVFTDWIRDDSCRWSGERKRVWWLCRHLALKKEQATLLCLHLWLAVVPVALKRGLWIGRFTQRDDSPSVLQMEDPESGCC